MQNDNYAPIVELHSAQTINFILILIMMVILILYTMGKKIIGILDLEKNKVNINICHLEMRQNMNYL